MKPTGRFAPSPTGQLHFGSLIAALASYLSVRSRQGHWLLRIEDIDKPREQPGATEHIIHTLATHGFEWDDQILYQSQRQTAYQYALTQLKAHIYACQCSRKQISQQARRGDYGWIYPGTCRDLALPTDHHAIRVKVSNNTIAFQDHIVTHYQQNLTQRLGDFVLRRADGLFAYQLAVVVDDAYQGITEVVRGMDLLDNTPRQIYLQQLLSYHTPHYAHLPLALSQQGQKLSKQNHAPILDNQQALNNLVNAMLFLGQDCPSAYDFDHLNAFWDFAIATWDINKVPTHPQQYPHHS